MRWWRQETPARSYSLNMILRREMASLALIVSGTLLEGRNTILLKENPSFGVLIAVVPSNTLLQNLSYFSVWPLHIIYIVFLPSKQWTLVSSGWGHCDAGIHFPLIVHRSLTCPLECGEASNSSDNITFSPHVSGSVINGFGTTELSIVHSFCIEGVWNPSVQLLTKWYCTKMFIEDV